MTELEELKQQLTCVMHKNDMLVGRINRMSQDVLRYLNTALDASEDASHLTVVRQRLSMSINTITEAKNQINMM